MSCRRRWWSPPPLRSAISGDLSVYALVRLAHVPGMVERDALGSVLRGLWCARPRLTRALVAAMIVAALVRATRERRWTATVPAGPPSLDRVTYPVGVVDLLLTTGVASRVVTPFEVGAFLSWKLFPAVRLLADRSAPIVAAMAAAASWRVVYQDDQFVLFARPGLELPVADRRGEPLEGAFP